MRWSVLLRRSVVRKVARPKKPVRKAPSVGSQKRDRHWATAVTAFTSVTSDATERFWNIRRLEMFKVRTASSSR